MERILEKGIKTYIYDLQLKNTFRISHASRDSQSTVIVSVHDGEYVGYGEAAATSYYGVTAEGIQQEVREVAGMVKDNLDKKPEEVWEIARNYLGSSFAQCALDIAMHDLHGKRLGLPLYKLWGLNLENIPLTSYTIGIDTVEKMVKKMREFPWPLYKIKLGTGEDVEIIRELRKHSHAVFRVDANAAWTAEQTIKNAIILRDLNVEFIEQPLPSQDTDGMTMVYRKSALPLIADESCISESDVQHCSKFFHGINIKLTKCGGITPAKRMITQAREKGLRVMLGCMTESTVGISAIAQMLPLLDYADMDGNLLIKNDIADGIKFCDGKVHFPKRNGTGAKLFT